MAKIKKGDMVQAIKGKDRGKTGKVIGIFLSEKRALVEGINLVKKHKRQARQGQQGGIVSIEAPMNVSNLMFFCKHCQRPVRLGFTVSKDNIKTRICKVCEEAV